MRILDQLRRGLAGGRTRMTWRWYLALAIVILMLPVLLAAHAETGVYYSKADVRFLAPLPIEGNVFQSDPLQIVPFASVVAHRYNAEDRGVKPQGFSAPLYGTGVRKGHQVYLPNSGSQWQKSFSRPVITVEVVGESAEAVAAERDAIVNRISALAEAAQQERDIGTQIRVTTDLDLTTAYITYIGVRNGRAELALAVLTVGLAAGIPLAADRIIARRREVVGLKTGAPGGIQRRMPASTSGPGGKGGTPPPVA